MYMQIEGVGIGTSANSKQGGIQGCSGNRNTHDNFHVRSEGIQIGISMEMLTG